MAKKSRHNRKDIVYSTNPDFNYEHDSGEESKETLPVSKQKLKVYIDTKAKKKGKQATLVNGFIGSDEDLKELGKLLKTKCAVGGSVKDGEILIQGDFRDKIVQILTSEGYNAKKL
ncbi:MAG: translation initiation factor [Bacteroidales bacterium]|nr:translation initiation factor [Bacteroidales bacterium]